MASHLQINVRLAMQNHTIRNINTERWFYLFLVVHLVCWTLVPFIVRYNLPLDSLEGSLWGHQLEWGYDKNPFLNAWLTALAIYLGGASGWMIYLFSQISVVLCFWAVFKLAKNIIAPIYAIISVMILEVVQYFNLHSIDFNDNTLELSLWALTTYFFYQALSHKTTNKILPWILTGVFAGLGMMAKYYTAALLAPMALFLLIDANSRKQLKTLAPYLGLATFLVIIIPHFVWLFYHDFITVTYVFKRTNNIRSWTNHFFYPARFAWQQFGTFLPAIILFLVLLIGKKPLLTDQKISLKKFDRTFLVYMGLGPFILTLLLSVVFGITLRAGWGMPLLSFWGILLLAYIQPNITQKKFYRFIVILFVSMALIVIGYSVFLTRIAKDSSANFPGAEMANILSKSWHDTYHTRLAYVAGDRWLISNISFYSSDHPAAFPEWNNARAPWIDMKDLQEKGGIFVWYLSEKEQPSTKIKTIFPRLLPTQIIKLNWKRERVDVEPIKIAVAFLPPSKKAT